MIIGGPAGRRRHDHQARRLRDRPRQRADADHPGRIGGRDGRLPRARAGPRRGGDARLRRLLARRRPLPVPHAAGSPTRAPRSPSSPSASSPSSRSTPPPTATTSRRRSATPCWSRSTPTPQHRFAAAGELADALRRGARRRVARRDRRDPGHAGRRDRRHPAPAAHPGDPQGPRRAAPRQRRPAPPPRPSASSGEPAASPGTCSP